MSFDSKSTQQLALATAIVAGGALGLKLAIDAATKTGKCPIDHSKKDGASTQSSSTASNDKTGSDGVLKRMGKLTDALVERFGGKKKQSVHSMLNRKHDIKIDEKGAKGQVLQSRLYMQFHVLEETSNPKNLPSITQKLHQKLKSSGIFHVIYDDIQFPTRISLLTWSEDVNHFIEKVRPILQECASSGFKLHTPMFGKTYSNGHEPDLKYSILQKPAKMALAADHEYAIWYPLRRSGSFYMQDPSLQCAMLLDHAVIGKSYGEANLAHDIRLISTGMDEKDNDFVIAIVGKELHPLANVVKDMRKTRHTSQFMDNLGPFYVCKKKYQFPDEWTGEKSDEISQGLLAGA